MAGKLSVLEQLKILLVGPSRAGSNAQQQLIRG
jgi:hypothetical protein